MYSFKSFIGDHFESAKIRKIEAAYHALTNNIHLGRPTIWMFKLLDVGFEVTHCLVLYKPVSIGAIADISPARYHYPHAGQESTMWEIMKEWQVLEPVNQSPWLLFQIEVHEMRNLEEQLNKIITLDVWDMANNQDAVMARMSLAC